VDRTTERDLDEPVEGSALTDALSPGRSETTFGDDPRAQGLLEVTQIWADSILSVRHYGPSGRTVTLSDDAPRRRLGLASLLIAGFVCAVAMLVGRHMSVEPPVELSEQDLAWMEQWTAEREQARATAPKGEAGVNPPTDDPLEQLADRARESMQSRLARAERAMDQGRAERRLLTVPPFVPAEQPGWLRFAGEQLIPRAEERAASGALPEHWRRALSGISAHPELLDEPDVARVAEDLPRGMWVRRARGDGPWLITSGLDPDRVTLVNNDQQRVELSARAALWPWFPSETELADQRRLADAAARLLYTDALARRASRDTCSGVQRLLAFPEHQSRGELHARAAWCALNAGDQAAARESAEAADSPLDLAIDPDARTVLLRTRARLALLEMDHGRASGDREFRSRTRDDAREALLTLKTHIVQAVKSPSDLAAVARELHLVATDAQHEQQEAHVRAAAWLAGITVLLLPLALIVDERRRRATGSDFFVDGGRLPVDPFPFVSRSKEGAVAHIPDGAQATLYRGGDPIPATGDVPLNEHDRLVTHIGDATFVLSRVHAPRGVPGDGHRVDWGYMSVLAALLMLSGAFTVVLATSDPAPHLSVQDMDTSVVSIAFQQPEPPTPLVTQPRSEPDAGEGMRTPGPEGARGRPSARRTFAKAPAMAANRAQRNREMVQREGILGAIDRIAPGGQFGQAGADEEINALLGGLVGPVGDQRGAGDGPRGDGLGGGCMSEKCAESALSGVGTRPGGTGREGDGKAPGNLGPRGEGVPNVGVRDPIVMGSAIDKATIDRIVKQHLPSIRFCYERELGRNSDLAGRLSVKFVIAKDGGVASASSAHDTLGSAAVADCVHERFRRMRFPPPKGASIVTVRYPLVFDAR